MLAEAVRAHRYRLGLSQEDLASRTGVSVRGIRKIETGRTDTPRSATARLLADAFGLTGAERDRFLQDRFGPTPAPTPGPGPGPGPETNGSALIRLPGGAVPPSSLGEPGLVGRVGELSALDSTARAAAAGAFRIVWIGGEAGAGKSTLAAALTAELTRRGWNTAWSGSPEVEGTPPAWAWADIVRRLMGSRFTAPASAEDGDLVSRLRPLLSGEASASGPTVAPFWVARAVVEFLGRCAGYSPCRPLLVVLDDVHRAGEETLQILRYAFTELVERPVLIAATFRPTEASAALQATWAALTGPRVDQLNLAGLAEVDVERLLQAHVGAAVAPDVVRLITDRTGGNPLFVTETARLIATEGIDAATEAVPTGVRNVLRRRLGSLPDPAQAVLGTAAVIGIDVDTEILLSLDHTDADTVLDGLEAAIRAGLLTETASGRVRFSHVLVRDTLYRDLPQVRRTHLHARVLATLERIRPGDTAALAHHALASATPTTAISAAHLAGQAADAASAACAHQEAASLLARAVELLDLTDRQPAGPRRRPVEPTDIDTLRLDLLCALVSARAHTGNIRGARTARGRAIELAQQLGDHHGLARAYTAFDAPTPWAMREYRQYDSALVDGLQAVLAATPSADPASRCRLLCTLALEIEAHDPDSTDRASAEAVSIAHQLDDPELICRALNARYRYLATLGPDRWAELDSVGRQQLAAATAAGLDAYRAQGHHILCMAHLARNDLDQAEWHLDRAAEAATSGQLGLALTILATFSGLRDLIAGRFDQAERTFAPVLAQLRRVGYLSVDEIELLVRFCVEHARAGPDTRERMAALAEQSRAAYERFGDEVAEPYTRTLIAAGDLDQARAVWNPRAAIPRDHYWFRWTVLRAENAVHLGDLDTAASCYQQLLPWAGHLPGLLHAHMALGPVDHTLGDVAVALNQPDPAARHYADAIAVAERVGSPHWAARSRQALQTLNGLAHSAADQTVSRSTSAKDPMPRRSRIRSDVHDLHRERNDAEVVCLHDSASPVPLPRR